MSGIRQLKVFSGATERLLAAVDDLVDSVSNDGSAQPAVQQNQDSGAPPVNAGKFDANKIRESLISLRSQIRRLKMLADGSMFNDEDERQAMVSSILTSIEGSARILDKQYEDAITFHGRDFMLGIEDTRFRVMLCQALIAKFTGTYNTAIWKEFAQ